MVLETTAADVLGRSDVTRASSGPTPRWVEDTSRKEVVDYMSSHRTRLLIEPDPADVERTCRSTEHAPRRREEVRCRR
jgi:hypothetical protein